MAGYKVAGGGLAFAGKLRKLFDRYVNIADLEMCIRDRLQHAGGNDLLLEHIVRRPFFERLLHQREFIESTEHSDVGRKAQGCLLYTSRCV